MMNRKKSKHRPKPVQANPLERFELAKDVQGAQGVKQALVARAALDRVQAGTATPTDLGNLVAAYNMSAMLMGRFSHGIEHVALLTPWRAAVVSIAEKAGQGVPSDEIRAISEGLDLHDAQLEVVTVDEVRTAAQAINKFAASAGLLPAPIVVPRVEGCQ